MDHTMIARVLRINAEIMAVSIEVEGMKAANMERYLAGESMAYPESEFIQAANAVHGYAADLHQLSF